MGSLPSTNMKDIVLELAARRLYESVADWFCVAAPTPWIKLSDDSKSFFIGLVIVQMPEDANTLQLTERSDAPVVVPELPQPSPPKPSPLHHPMVVWETLILFICSIVIGHLIK